MRQQKCLMEERLSEVKDAYFEAIDTKEIEHLRSKLDVTHKAGSRPLAHGQLLADSIPHTFAFPERGPLAAFLFGLPRRIVIADVTQS